MSDASEHESSDVDPLDLDRFVGKTFACIDDPAAFWRSLTPSQALALLRKAPRVAGSWIERSSPEYGGARWARHDSDGIHIAMVDRTGDWNGPALWGYRIRRGLDDVFTTTHLGESTEVDAKTACDAALRERGWVLE